MRIIGTFLTLSNDIAVEECLRAFLPLELRDGVPTGFAMTGHVGNAFTFQMICRLLIAIEAHVNLNDEYLPYKHVIGQLILDVGNVSSTSPIQYLYDWIEKQENKNSC